MVSDEDSNLVKSEKMGSGLFGHMFKERELLLRSDGEVRYLRLSSRMQAGICAGAFAFLIWSSGVSISSWMQHVDLNNKAAEIVEAKLFYNNLRNEVDRFEVRMSELSKNLSNIVDEEKNASTATLKNEIRQFGKMGADLRQAVKSLSIDLDLPEDEKQRIITSRENLHNQISSLENKLYDANQYVKNMQADVANINNQMAENNSLRERVAKERDKLLLAVANLEDSLENAKNENKSLSEYSADLKDDLAQSHIVVGEFERNDAQLRQQLTQVSEELDKLSTEHADTQQRVAVAAKRLMNTSDNDELVVASGPKYIAEQNSLEMLEFQTKRIVGDLAKAKQEKSTMEKAIDTVLVGLERVAGYDRNLDNKNTKDTELVLSLLDQIESLHDEQYDMVSRLNTQASANITQVENLIRTTGIDPNRLLEISGLPIGQGGPLIETDFVSGTDENLESKVASLEENVMRWEALQKITKCIPMMSPVDYYNLTSDFGKRKDPITGKSAMHNGLDLGGWAGTDVWSTAPGKVTFAGSSGRYGKMVEIDHGCGIKTIYGHLKKVLVNKGQDVDHRQIIGKLGSSGRSTGPHVHFEVQIEGKPVDPMKFIEAGRHVFKS